MKKLLLLSVAVAGTCTLDVTAAPVQPRRAIVNMDKEVGNPKKRAFTAVQLDKMDRIFTDALAVGDVKSAEAVIRHAKQGDKTAGMNDRIKKYEEAVKGYKPKEGTISGKGSTGWAVGDEPGKVFIEEKQTAPVVPELQRER